MFHECDVEIPLLKTWFFVPKQHPPLGKTVIALRMGLWHNLF